VVREPIHQPEMRRVHHVEKEQHLHLILKAAHVQILQTQHGVQQQIIAHVTIQKHG